MSSPISDRERADLVAYLDGELSGEAARAVEARISLDPQLRAEAESLKQAWDLLDFLPRPPEPSPAFTEKTLSRLEPVRKKGEAGWARRWGPFVAGWAACVAASALAGYFAFKALAPLEPGDRELLRDLRLIENKRQYELVEDFDFLSALADPDLFGD
jgi:anti-sigma factor RsiW